VVTTQQCKIPVGVEQVTYTIFNFCCAFWGPAITIRTSLFIWYINSADWSLTQFIHHACISPRRDTANFLTRKIPAIGHPHCNVFASVKHFASELCMASQPWSLNFWPGQIVKMAAVARRGQTSRNYSTAHRNFHAQRFSFRFSFSSFLLSISCLLVIFSFTAITSITGLFLGLVD